MTKGENCSSACPTQDHLTFGECCRSKNIKSMWLGGTGPSATDQRQFERTNQEFRNAVQAGLNPAAVSDRAIHQAYDDASKG